MGLLILRRILHREVATVFRVKGVTRTVIGRIRLYTDPPNLIINGGVSDVQTPLVNKGRQYVRCLLAVGFK